MNEDPQVVKKVLDKSKSLYDQSRDTVGKIYRDAHLTNKEDYIEVGDMSRELTTSLVEDINDAIKAFDARSFSQNDGKPYWLMVHEKKDLQMKTAMARRMIYSKFRPYPEDDTTVFWKNPKTQDLRFCWCLPHWSDMDNVLANPHDWPIEYLTHIAYWKANNLEPFGFIYDKKERWIPNPKWQDKRIDEYGKKKSSN